MAMKYEGELPADVAARNELRPGMSVIVDINTKPGVIASLAPQTSLAANRQVRTVAN